MRAEQVGKVNRGYGEVEKLGRAKGDEGERARGVRNGDDSREKEGLSSP